MNYQNKNIQSGTYTLIQRSCLLGYLVYICCTLSWAQAKIIPTPQKVKALAGQFTFQPTMTISLVNDYQAKTLFAAKQLNQALKEYFQTSTYLEPDPEKADMILVLIPSKEALKIGIPPDKLGEAYRLKIYQNKILIEAPQPRGIFYAVMSLIQLIEQAEEQRIDHQEIIDWPDFALRGISHDFSQGQVSTPENLKKIIRHLARYKINTYLLYLEDALFLDAYPTVAKGRDALTEKQMREIVDFANQYFIDVIPVFETLSDQENILTQEQFLQIAEFPGASAFCVSCPFTYTFLEKVLQEIAQTFNSPYLHIGGQLAYDLGQGKSKKLLQEQGFTGLYQAHYQKIFQICNQLGKKVMMDSEVIAAFPALLEAIPPQVLLLESANSPQRLGLVENPYLKSVKLHSAHYLVPLYEQSFHEMKIKAKQAKEQSAQGIIAQHGGGQGSETFKELLYLTHARLGQVAWKQDAPIPADWERLYFQDFYGVDSPLSQEIHQLLEKPSFQISWRDFWQHPLLASSAPDLSHHRSNQSLVSDTTRLTLLLDSLQPLVKHNADHLDLIRLLKDLQQYYLYKRQTQQRFQLYFQGEEEDLNSLINLAEENILRLEILREEYGKVWLRYYLPEGLAVIQSKFERLIRYFEETKDQLLLNKRLDSPLISSEWIFDCKNTIDTVNCYTEAVFRKDFFLEEKPQIAFIQIIAETYAELTINDQPIQTNYLRAYASAYLSRQRIRLSNISDALKEGNNTIKVKVINYNQGLPTSQQPVRGTAGLNALAWIKTPHDQIYIRSDASWRAQELNEPKNVWHSVSVKSYPFPIIAPNFLSERPSWIVRD